MRELESANVEPKIYKNRKRVLRFLGKTLFRSERRENLGGLDKAEELLKDGYGIIVVLNHFSLKDGPQAVREVFENEEIIKKTFICPLAYHIYKEWYNSKLTGKFLDVSYRPIVTRSTIEKGKNDGHPLGYGQKEYFAEAIEVLRRGGVVAIPPQATREASLSEPENPALGTFVLGAKRNGLERFAFLFVGLGIKGVTDYSKVKGCNIFRKYTVGIGECLTRDEIMQRAGGDFRNVDLVAYQELNKVVPPEYKMVA